MGSEHLPIEFLPEKNDADDGKEYPLSESTNAHHARIVPQITECRYYQNDEIDKCE